MLKSKRAKLLSSVVVLALYSLYYNVKRSRYNNVISSLMQQQQQDKCQPQDYAKSDNICSMVPRDASVDFLWDTLGQDLQGQTGSRITANTDFILSHYMRKAVRGRPLPTIWGNLLHKLYTRISTVNARRSVRVLVLCNSNNSWPNALERVFDAVFGRNVVQVKVVSKPYATTEYYTHAMQYGLLFDDITSDPAPADIIINALSRVDSYKYDRADNMIQDNTYKDHRFHVAQRFLRTCLESQPCDEQPPVVVFIDDYLTGNRDNLYLSDSIQHRVVQQLSDHYQAAYISPAQVLRQFALFDDQSFIFSRHEDWQTVTLWTILYSFVTYTIEYCENDERYKMATQLEYFKPVLQHRVDQVIPPYLDGDISLETVSQLWADQEDLQAAHREDVCMPERQVKFRRCEFETTRPAAQGRLRSYMKKHTRSTRGWSISDYGVMESIAPDATINLDVKLKGSQSVSQVTVFIVRQDATRSNAQLEWSIKAGTVTMSGLVNATHNSPDSVALPKVINLEPVAANTTLHFHLQVVHGSSVSLGGIYLCDDRKYDFL